MKTHTKPKFERGAVSILLVVSAGTIALLMTLFTYRQAIATHEVTSSIQLSTDYREKEDAILRSLVAIVPNRAIRTMQSNSNMSISTRGPMQWATIFDEAIDLANARTSISADLKTTLGITNSITANSGDSDLSNPDAIFDPISTDTSSYTSSYVSAGINRVLAGDFPPPLQTGSTTIINRDADYPIISTQKIYGDLAASDVGVSVVEYPDFNLLKYPQINFGYAQPGEDFVAKRNWWAFSMELARSDDAITNAARSQRDFVLSIYEIPSQLAISASSFMSLGQYSTGEDWQNVTISGGVFAGRAIVEGNTSLPSLASRRGMTLSADSTIGGESFVSNPFTPGLREAYQLTEGEFFPVSLASESGRVAFVPINRGVAFFDRFANEVSTQTISPTGWNEYSVGAMQCAMRLDITECVSDTDPTPTEFRFSYYKNGVREEITIPLLTGPESGLPPGYLYACQEDQSYDFGTAVVDLAYGTNGSYAFESGATGLVTYNNARFGDPAFGYLKSGYYRPSYPFETRTLDSGKICVVVYPQRIEDFLEALDADDTSINHSLAVNVDYSTSTGSLNLDRPNIPSTVFDYGLIIEESANMTSFSEGFSLVTNLRLYFGDDFNIVSTTPPTGYTPTGDYYPPVSIFAPEKRYGVDVDPYAVSVSGQIGSLAEEDGDVVNPLDSTTASGNTLSSDRVTINLEAIPHPAELPPITMMNWLITIEEVRREFND